MSGKHAVVALFVPNVGCPHRCVFCDQQAISGAQRIPHAEEVRCAAETALQSLGVRARETELAFFGGSFTAVSQDYMLELLEAALPYVADGRFFGIRVSTRPDAVPAKMLTLLKNYRVTAIELGAQSMCDRVLRMNERGHTAEDVRQASERIRNAGISLGLQMMTGLYGSTPEDDRQTARQLAQLHPDTIRIYPTVVMKNTRLEQLFRAGEYRPLELAAAVALCAELQDFFEEKQIRILRTGLHSGGDVAEEMVAGPYHPAFGELCMGVRFRRRIEEALDVQQVAAGGVTVRVNPADRSAVAGQKKCNLEYFRQKNIVLTLHESAEQARGSATLSISQ